MSGAIRGSLNVLDDICRKVIEPLNADVYLCTWEKYFKWPGFFNVGPYTGLRYLGSEICRFLPWERQSYDFIRNEFPLTFAKLSTPIIEGMPENDIKKRLGRVIKTKFYSEEEFEKFAYTEFADYFNSPFESKINQLKMFYMIAECNRLMTETSASSGSAYDLVVRIRPDLILPSAITPEMVARHSPEELIVRYITLGLDDAIFIAAPEVMNRVCGLWDEIMRVKTLSPYVHYRWFHSHFLLEAWCLTQRVRMRHLPMFSAMNLDGIQKSVSEFFPAYGEFLQDIENSRFRNDMGDLERFIRNKIREKQV